MLGPIFELGDPTFNVALVGLLPGVTDAQGREKLVELAENVDNDFTARRLLKSLPAPAKVKKSKLEALKEFFYTQEFFHHERHIGDMNMANRVVWATVRGPDTSPEELFVLARHAKADHGSRALERKLKSQRRAGTIEAPRFEQHVAGSHIHPSARYRRAAPNRSQRDFLEYFIAPLGHGRRRCTFNGSNQLRGRP